jgi:dienelactone hydrolase
MTWSWLCPLLLVSQLASPPVAGHEAAPIPLNATSKFSCADTLSCGDEPSDDAKECLNGLAWIASDFAVTLEPPAPGCGDWLVRFPSARPIGNPKNDLAAMEWYAARDPQGNIRRSPAVVVVHESGKQMTVGRLLAKGFNSYGLHSFLLQLPGYGVRRDEELSDAERGLTTMLQAIADVRRARDAVAGLPPIDPTCIAVQGTSLGGFVTATAAGLDRGYDRVFILLAGGDLEEVIFNGAKDAAKVRRKLAAAGVTDQQIKELAHQVEPLRLAHRLDPTTTWLYTGKFDDVVPPRCSHALAKAARLSAEHHMELEADHYSGILYLPKVVRHMAVQILGATARVSNGAPAPE